MRTTPPGGQGGAQGCVPGDEEPRRGCSLSQGMAPVGASGAGGQLGGGIDKGRLWANADRLRPRPSSWTSPRGGLHPEGSGARDEEVNTRSVRRRGKDSRRAGQSAAGGAATLTGVCVWGGCRWAEGAARILGLEAGLGEEVSREGEALAQGALSLLSLLHQRPV